MKPWAEVEADPDFKVLPPIAQNRAQEQYFNEVVVPQLRQDQIDPAKQQFFSQFGRSIIPEDTGQGLLGAMVSSGARGLASVPEGIVSGTGAVASLIPGMDDNFLQRAGRGMEEFTEETFPINPTLEDSFAVKAPAAVGQGLGFLGLMAGTAGLGATPAIARGVSLGTAGMMGSEQGEETANAYQETDPWKRAALILGGGATEAITESLFGFGSRGWAGDWVNRAKNAVKPGSGLIRFSKTAGGEGVEEIIAGEGHDQLTKALIAEDPLRPGYSTTGVPMPPDMFTMENLYNRLEEGALGAIGGTVFAGAEALRGRTGVDEAFSLRMEAKTRLDELSAKENRTPEEEAELAQIQQEDQNLSAWLERQGAETIRPALDQIINNPEASETDRRQATEYASLLDNLQAVENAPDVTPEEVQAARTAVDNHPLNGINRLSRTNQNDSINKTADERRKELAARVEEQIQRERPDPTSTEGLAETVNQTAEAVAEVAPATAAAMREVVADLPAIEETAELAPATAAVVNTTPESSTIQAPTQDVTITQDGSPLVDDATGMTSENYRINGTQGNATVRIQGNNAFLKDIQIGEEDSGSRGKGMGTKTYEALGNLLAGRGITLQSTRGSHGTTISPAALRIWQKLAERGLAVQTGMEDTRVYDRSGKDLGIHAIPTYDFINPAQNVTPNQTSATASLTPATTQAAASMGVQPETAAVAEPVTDTIVPAEEVTAPTDATSPPIPQQQTSTPDAAQQVPVAEPSPGGAARGTGVPAQAPVSSLQLKRPKVRLGLAVSPREVIRATKKFERISNVRVTSVQELAADPAFRSMWNNANPQATEEDYQRYVQTELGTAEGISNDGTGRAVILAENLAIYDTDQARAKQNKTTAGEEAMMRVLFHENWHGVEAWLRTAPEAAELRNRYDALLNEISPQELDDMAKRRYANLSNWRNDAQTKRHLQSEVMAERREAAEITGEPDSLIEKFLAWLKDVLKAVTGSNAEVTPDELQDLFDAWYRAQKSTQTRAGPQASQPEIPARPNIPISYEDRGTDNTLDEVLDSMWRPFYVAWESGDQTVPLEQAWAEEISDPDYLFSKDLELRMEKRNKGRSWIDFTPAPSQTTPETGPKQSRKKSQTTEPTAEDIARRFPQFSQPERTPEQKLQRLKEIHAELSYATFHTEKEGLDPTLATRMEREFANSGRDVRFYRKSLSDIERRALAEEELNLLISMSPDGPSQDFGNKLVTYLNGVTPDIFGDEGNDLSKTNLINYLLKSPQDRGQMGIDAEELQRARSQYASQYGAGLRSIGADRVYGPLRKMEEKANEMASTGAKENIGTDDFKGLADTANAERAKQMKEAAKDLAPTLPAITDAAQNAADEIDYMEAGMEGMDPVLAKKIRELNERVERLGRLKEMRKRLVAGQSGPAASRPEIPQNMTLAELDKMITEEEASITKLTNEIKKAETKAKAKPREKKPKKQKVTDNASLHDYVNGADTAGMKPFVEVMQKHINGAGLNRAALTAELTNSFKNADPNFITGVVNRVADYIDGAATEEGIDEDAKKAVNYDARAKRLVVANIARESAENAPESTETDPFVELTAQRLKGEMSVGDFQKGIVALGIEEQTAFAYSQKVDQDRARIADAKVQRELNAQAKKDMAAFKRDAEQYARKTEATIDRLSKEFSDTLSSTKAKDIDAYKALLNNYIGVNGPPITEEVFIEEAERLNIPEEGYTRLMGVLDMQRKRAAAVQEAKARIKQEAQDKKEIEAFDRNAEATISKLSKEFSDTHAWVKPADVTEYKALLNNYLGVKGPPISEQEFLEGAKKLRMSDSASSRLLGVLNIQRSRAAAVQDAKARQKAIEKAEAEARREREKSTKEAEAKIAALAKEFSDTLPAKSQAKEATDLQRLINDYTGKNGPVISDEAFEKRAAELNIPESVLNRLRGVLQMARKREALVADTKARQAEAERLQKEKEKFEREAKAEISKLATAFSDTLSEKAKKDASDLKVLANSFLGKEGPPISEEQFLARAAALNLTPATAQNLLKLFQESRRRDVAVRYAKAVQKAQEAKERAIEAMVKKLDKVKNPTPTKLRQRSTFVNSIMGAMETGILDSDAVRAAFSEAYDLHGLTPERLREMGDLLQKIESLKEGIPKESFLLEFNALLNSIAPTASFVTHAHSALMGYVLSGVGTMLMQTTGINRFINPLAGTVEILWSAPGSTTEKLGRTINPKNFFRIYMQGMKEVGENLQQGIAGLSGVKTSVGQGLGAIPSSLAAVTPRDTSLSYTPFGQINKYRFNTPKLLKAMGLDRLVQATRYPAWMASRSFQVIRAAEGIIGGADKNMQFRAQMTYALMQADPKLSFNQAYSKVSDALGDQTTEMWQEAYKQADAEIANKGPVNKWSRKQRATELVQDALEEKWAKNLANRPREIAALYGYKQDPITPLGAWAYKGVSGVLNKDKGPLQALKFSFLFARFFTNAIETAYSRTPLGGLGAMFIDTAKSEGRLDEREKRIIQMFGSLQGYKDARIARSVSGTAVMGGIAGLMVMALKGWDPDDDEPPFFWITGDPIGEFSKKGSMEAGGWWKANTLYIGPVRINYVNASPEYAIVLSAMGSTGDRFMYDKLLNFKENKETGEYERSNYQAYGKPVIEAMAAPISRSTFRQWYDMLEAAYDGDFTKLTKAVSNPAVGTAVALSPAGLIPSIKTLEKIDRSSEQPRTAKTPSQAAMGSVPFADELGLDSGKPLTTPFGNPLTPYPFWSVLSNSQEVSPEVSRAARTLTDLGVSRLGPREEYFGWGMAEIASDGKKYLLGDAERGKVLQDIGRRFASKINNNSQRLRRLEKEKDGRNKVRDAISDLASKARAEALYNYKPTR